MNQQEIYNQYRFSGYNLPMIQLDETGNSYIYIAEPHPYYINQPEYWQKPYYGNPGNHGLSVEVQTNQDINNPSGKIVVEKSGLKRFLSF